MGTTESSVSGFQSVNRRGLPTPIGKLSY
jgi:hypothetical protein